jgi:hypothetical protein
MTSPFNCGIKIELFHFILFSICFIEIRSLSIACCSTEVRWDILQPNRGCKYDSLENSNKEKLSALNQQLCKDRFIRWPTKREAVAQTLHIFRREEKLLAP